MVQLGGPLSPFATLIPSTARWVSALLSPNLGIFLVLQARDLRAFLALPSCSSAAGFMAESRQLPIHALQAQETLRLLRESGHLAKLFVLCSGLFRASARLS